VPWKAPTFSNPKKRCFLEFYGEKIETAMAPEGAFFIKLIGSFFP
jgi:hypothetical protein